MNTVTSNRNIILQSPQSENALAIYELITNSKPLDVNSEYLYLLLCTHYRDTCVAAFLEGEVVGVTTGYILPDLNNTLFLWQIAVGRQVRNYGLGKAMIKHLLRRRSCKNVKYIEATVSPSNEASLKLFKSLAQDLKTEFQQTPFFDKALFKDKDHEEENLVRVGPILKGC